MMIKKEVILTLGLFLLAAFSVQAQTISAGGGVGYGSKSENINFQVNAYYSVPDLPLRIGGDVGYSEPEDNLTHIEGNLNLHIMAVDTDLFSLYGITGLNVLHARLSDGDVSASDTETGFNVGAGAEVDLGFGRGFGEAKYILGRSDEEQLIIGAGVRVNISN